MTCADMTLSTSGLNNVNLCVQHSYCELVYFVGDALMTVESKVNWPLIGQFTIGITQRVKTVQVVSYVKSQATEASN